MEQMINGATIAVKSIFFFCFLSSWEKTWFRYIGDVWDGGYDQRERWNDTDTEEGGM